MCLGFGFGVLVALGWVFIVKCFGIGIWISELDLRFVFLFGIFLFWVLILMWEFRFCFLLFLGPRWGLDFGVWDLHLSFVFYLV